MVRWCIPTDQGQSGRHGIGLSHDQWWPVVASGVLAATAWAHIASRTAYAHSLTGWLVRCFSRTGEEHNTWEPKEHLDVYTNMVEQVDAVADVEEHQTMRVKAGKGRGKGRGNGALRKDASSSVSAEEGQAQPVQESVQFDSDDYGTSVNGLETLEADGSWKPVTVYQHTATGNVVLWYGGAEYEGMGDAYRMAVGKETGKWQLFDGDGDVIATRIGSSALPTTTTTAARVPATEEQGKDRAKRQRHAHVCGNQFEGVRSKQGALSPEQEARRRRKHPIHSAALLATTSSPIETLPDEILGMIFGLVSVLDAHSGYPSILLAVPAVCKRWKDVCLNPLTEVKVSFRFAL